MFKSSHRLRWMEEDIFAFEMLETPAIGHGLEQLKAQRQVDLLVELRRVNIPLHRAQYRARGAARDSRVHRRLDAGEIVGEESDHDEIRPVTRSYLVQVGKLLGRVVAGHAKIPHF